MNTNTRDLGIGNGKGDKSRVTSANVYRARFPDGMGPNMSSLRSDCCEAPFIVCGNVTKWYECMACQKACDLGAFEIT